MFSYAPEIPNYILNNNKKFQNSEAKDPWLELRSRELQKRAQVFLFSSGTSSLYHVKIKLCQIIFWLIHCKLFAYKYEKNLFVKFGLKYPCFSVQCSGGTTSLYILSKFSFAKFFWLFTYKCEVKCSLLFSNKGSF